MLTFFCPECWGEVTENQSHCPSCGNAYKDFSKVSYEDKLIAALSHPDQDRQVVAAQVLGYKQSIKALPHFEKILQTENKNYVLIKTILESLSIIDHPLSLQLIHNVSENSTGIIRNTAYNLLHKQGK